MNTIKILHKIQLYTPIACFVAIGLMLLATWLVNYFTWLELGRMYAEQSLK